LKGEKDEIQDEIRMATFLILHFIIDIHSFHKQSKIHAYLSSFEPEKKKLFCIGKRYGEREKMSLIKFRSETGSTCFGDIQCVGSKKFFF